MNADPALPGSEVLLAAGAHRLLAPVVAAGDRTLRSLRPSQARYEPGRRLVVRYAAEVQDAAGTRSTQTLCAVAQKDPLPEGVAVIDAGAGARCGVWRYPYDPFLPGLAKLASPRSAGDVLSGLGVAATVTRVRPVVYRPGRRAVLRVTSDEGVLYVKVLRPRAAQRLPALHAAFAPTVAVPRVIASDPELGVIVAATLGGHPLTRPLVDGGPLPAPATVASLLQRIQHVRLPDTAPRTSTTVDHCAAVLRFAVPQERDRITGLAEAAPMGSAAGEVTAHGDFYEGQILVSDAGDITGLLDLDGARTAPAAHDPATLLGHLIGLAHVHPDAAPRIDSYRRGLEEAFAAFGDLKPAVTAVLLGLAATPFRRQSPGWPEKVSRWLDLVEAQAAVAI